MCMEVHWHGSVIQYIPVYRYIDSLVQNCNNSHHVKWDINTTYGRYSVRLFHMRNILYCKHDHGKLFAYQKDIKSNY